MFMTWYDLPQSEEIWSSRPQFAPRRNARAQFGERIGKQLADDERAGDFERGGTAHADAHGKVAVDRSAESAEVHSAFAELDQHAFHVVRPRRGGIVLEFADPENLRLRERG